MGLLNFIYKRYKKEVGNVIPTLFSFSIKQVHGIEYVIPPLILSHIISSISNITQVFIWRRKKIIISYAVIKLLRVHIQRVLFLASIWNLQYQQAKIKNNKTIVDKIKNNPTSEPYENKWTQTTHQNKERNQKVTHCILLFAPVGLKIDAFGNI